MLNCSFYRSYTTSFNKCRMPIGGVQRKDQARTTFWGAFQFVGNKVRKFNFEHVRKTFGQYTCTSQLQLAQKAKGKLKIDFLCTLIRLINILYQQYNSIELFQDLPIFIKLLFILCSLHEVRNFVSISLLTVYIFISMFDGHQEVFL